MNKKFNLVNVSIIKYQTTNSNQIRSIDLIYFYTKNQLKNLRTIKFRQLTTLWTRVRPVGSLKSQGLIRKSTSWKHESPRFGDSHRLSMSWWFLHFWLDNNNTKCIGNLIILPALCSGRRKRLNIIRILLLLPCQNLWTISAGRRYEEAASNQLQTVYLFVPFFQECCKHLCG